jgi:hypothetical protein
MNLVLKWCHRSQLTFLPQAFAWLFVAFRLFARFQLIRSPGLDDLFVILSLVRVAFLADAFERMAN